MGMDQAFIAGALAAYGGVARKDSADYSRRVSQKDVIEAAAKAKTYLKEAIKKVKTLAEEEFEKLRLWLESDEDTFIITADLLKKIKIEAKRSIKLAEDKVKHPGSLGAVNKKQLSSNGKYPDLRETSNGQAVTDSKYLKRTSKGNNIAPSAPVEEDTSDPDAKPPRYESIQQRLNPQQPYVHFPDGITQNMPPPMMVANGAWLPYNNTFQHPPQAANPMFMSIEWIEEQKKPRKQCWRIMAFLQVRGNTTLRLLETGT